MKRVVFCWPCPAGYMAACYRELAKRGNIDFAVLGFSPADIACFDRSLISGFDNYLMTPEQKNDYAFIEDWVARQQPSLVVIPGWGHKPYCRLRRSPKLKSCKFILGADAPGRGLLRRIGARIVLARYLRSMDRVIVTGERAYQYMRFLGVPAGRIRRGLYGINYNEFTPAMQRRLERPDGWPRRFLYVGRYIPWKATDVLVEAYRRYRDEVADPWPLTCCGRGPLVNLLNSVPGIDYRGFVQPFDQPALFSECGALLMPSRYDPWPLIIVEACAAGLPVICTEACGSAVENVRPYYSGLTVPPDDAIGLARAMLWVHQHHAVLPEWGQRAQQFASAYSAQAWADRWEACFEELGSADAQPSPAGKDNASQAAAGGAEQPLTPSPH